MLALQHVLAVVHYNSLCKKDLDTSRRFWSCLQTVKKIFSIDYNLKKNILTHY